MKTLDTFPRLSFGIFPTPLYRLPNLSAELGINLYIKRDDMTGVSLGGNKVRKLEYLLADAQTQGCDYVMTTGGAQSNHAMLTAACANRIGMKSILVLKKRGVWKKKGNQILNDLLGADVRFVDSDSYDDVYAEMDRIAAELASQGHKAYSIPVGGSVPLGSLGYVRCMEEVAQQCDHNDIHLDHIVCVAGSGGTCAGVAMGAHLFLPQAQVLAMSVDTDPFADIVLALMQDLGTMLELPQAITETGVQFFDRTGDGYAIPTPEGNAAIRLMAQKEGIILDPVYTGKAFGGLCALAREGFFPSGANVLFLHSGGAGGVFAVPID
jgi:D-cysteine desulfhydrase family pyridoxal phosphate-dependent enzyme